MSSTSARDDPRGVKVSGTQRDEKLGSGRITMNVNLRWCGLLGDMKQSDSLSSQTRIRSGSGNMENLNSAIPSSPPRSTLSQLPVLKTIQRQRAGKISPRLTRILMNAEPAESAAT